MSSQNKPYTGKDASFLPSNLMDLPIGLADVQSQLVKRAPGMYTGEARDGCHFTLAPVYQCTVWHGQPLIDFNLLEQFMADINQTIEVGLHVHPNRLFSEGIIKDDVNITQSLTEPWFGVFTAWTRSLNFHYKDGDKEDWYGVHHQDIAGVRYFMPFSKRYHVYIPESSITPVSLCVIKHNTKGA